MFEETAETQALPMTARANGADAETVSAPDHAVNAPETARPDARRRRGRPAGTPNKVGKIAKEAILEAEPHAVLIRVMRGEKFMRAGSEGGQRRVACYPTLKESINAAETLLSKIVPSLKAIEQQTNLTAEIETRAESLTPLELAQRLGLMLELTTPPADLAASPGLAGASARPAQADTAARYRLFENCPDPPAPPLRDSETMATKPLTQSQNFSKNSEVADSSDNTTASDSDTPATKQPVAPPYGSVLRFAGVPWSIVAEAPNPDRPSVKLFQVREAFFDATAPGTLHKVAGFEVCLMFVKKLCGGELPKHRLEKIRSPLPEIFNPPSAVHS